MDLIFTSPYLNTKKHKRVNKVDRAIDRQQQRPWASTSTQQRQKDPTFRNYSSSSAQNYAKNRPGYPEAVISLILNQHTSTGGALDLLLDVGCGPGTATRSLAPHFQHAVGADPGRSMIETARSIPSTTASGEPVTYEVCASDALSSLSALERYYSPADGTATAAHWFDYPDFYREAARVLKPGGSIILWCTKGFFVDERTTPNAKKVQALWQKFENEVTRAHEMPGNRLTRELYAGLPLPWSEYEYAYADRDRDRDQDRKEQVDDETKRLLGVFDEKDYKRLVFNDHGQVKPGEEFFMSRRVTFEQSRRMLGTVSPVTRWREANKDKLESGEVEDVVDQILRQTRELFDEVPEGKGRDWVEGGEALVVMVFKKKA
ncbi:hypothetical protein LTR47_010061 [Exophiala xenobiotica]|nr:hypothetical protein LTR47_010061 [Exophiala xenobiotica]KAK5249356.1 hypothetical protein LTS06_005722 [Exophiala xenobiotica]KAK5359063.1 hypothetical protein LTR11_010679 [Exophiala xenobiotica]KAK5360925.1 hypothetical protein LTS03_010497 [Exophiala xenobiotica]